MLQQDPTTRYREQGIIAVDNTLIDHQGELIPDAGWFWDHAEERYKIAQDYIFINYVCPGDKHYPLDFRRFRKASLCVDLETPFLDHTTLTKELIDGVCGRNIPGTFAFDSCFTNAPILNHIHGNKFGNDQPRGYVGAIKLNRNVEYRGHLIKVGDLATSIPPSQRRVVPTADRKQWYFTCTLRIPEVQHKVRVLILWQNQEDEKPRLALVTNRLGWEARRIVRAYRHRWTGMETFHRDGKQQLGLGDCQLRDHEGETRYVHLVMLAYSVLMQQLGHSHAYEWAFQKLMTIGEACRAVLRETLRRTLTGAMQHVLKFQWTLEQVVADLGLMGATLNNEQMHTNKTKILSFAKLQFSSEVHSSDRAGERQNDSRFLGR